MKRFIHPFFIASLVLLQAARVYAQSSDPLPSWNENQEKQAITLFVRKITTEGQTHYVSASRTHCSIRQ